MNEATMVGYIGTLESGRTKPILIEAVRADGAHVQLVAKLTGRQLDKGALTRELVAANLARRLGLETPTPYLLHLPDNYREMSLPSDVEAAIEGGYFPTFATEYLPKLIAFVPDRKLHEMHLQKAAEIFTFDALVVNRDRSEHGNVNCLTDSNRFVLIDHETALDAQLIGSSIYIEPWKPAALGPMRSIVKHIFYDSLSGEGVDFTPIRKKWMQISLADVDAILHDVPVGWRGAERGDAAIRQYLSDLLSNMSAALDTVEEFLQWSP
ncbi:HipA family kinase [Dyella japonica]|uniref:HipA-like kinase domain-containing protein n=1 Tax=Dyella japonica TaxID=231455 RepID=A0ABV2JYR7_9GAMM